MPITEKIAQEILRRQNEERGELAKLISQSPDANPEKWAKICRDNLNFITSTIKEHGWPAEHLFADRQAGEVVEYAAFLCVQHGDANCMEIGKTIRGFEGNAEKIEQIKTDNQQVFAEFDEIISQQKQCLELMQQGLSANHYIAFLTDRIARNECRSQIYGTQIFPNPINPKKFLEVTNPEKRTEMGLDGYEVFEKYCEDFLARKKPSIPPQPPLIRSNKAIQNYAETGEWPQNLSTRNVNKPKADLINAEIIDSTSSGIEVERKFGKNRLSTTKAAEAEDIIPQKKSWQEILSSENNKLKASKDDSTITR